MSETNNNAQKVTNEYAPEVDFDHFMSDHQVRSAVALKGKATLLYPIAEGSAKEALAAWIATLARVYVKEIGATSRPLVEKVWLWSQSQVDIDLRVGVRGEYRKIKVTTEMISPQSVRLKIQCWNKLGQPQKTWERYGYYYGNKDGAGFKTLPLR
jgi:hypothetical protein